MASMSSASFEEESSVLTAIFGDTLDESWTENPEFVKYVTELTSYGTDRLSREADHLLEEKRNVDKQTEDLAFNNYKTFIQTANCSSDIFKDFQIIEGNLTSLQEKLPDFSKECQSFLETAHTITQSRKSNTLTLQKHMQLLEILEVPQLMDTCVRNNYYEEALELAAYVRRLEKKYSTISVIHTICDEVKRCTQLLLAQLLQQLRSEIQLPACLRVIGFLRHMDIFTEAELRLKFLQARDCWFQNVLSSVPKHDAYTHLAKVIELSRVHLFDIITQYRAIFTDDDPLVKQTSSGPRESQLLQSWVQRKVDQFLDSLKRDLEQGVGSRLDSLLGQCMYFGLSFSRVGCDFRGLLAEIFQDAALKHFTHSVQAANVKYDKTMETYTLVLKSSHQATSYLTMEADILNPPSSLLQFTPLGLYVNDILTALNELRLCAPINIAADVTHCLKMSLCQLCDTISNFYRLEHDSFTDEEQTTFCRMCEVFATDLISHINKCLQVLFSPTHIAKAVGVTPQQLQAMGSRIYMVDSDEVVTPLKEFLPDDSVPTMTEPNSGSVATELADNEEEVSNGDGEKGDSQMNVQSKLEEESLNGIEAAADDVKGDTVNNSRARVNFSLNEIEDELEPLSDQLLAKPTEIPAAVVGDDSPFDNTEQVPTGTGS
ncbi:conserved oligomeric Golgi complex subunit 8-like [Watersipora subatra]|uniref:conserved oligomeric Golgi complex subunit 8-like n=1 Tax=Watersipora subatra TaxID=2589382 RepID=UPI00355BC53C